MLLTKTRSKSGLTKIILMISVICTLTVLFAFKALAAPEVTKITSISITGLEIPVTDGTPDMECVSNTVGARVGSVSWVDSEGVNYYPWTPFQPAEVYTARIDLHTESGYEFAESVSATVCGFPATLNEDTFGYYLSCTFSTATSDIQKPTIVSYTKGGEYTIGDTVKLSVEAETFKGATLDYQWYRTEPDNIYETNAIEKADDEAYGKQSFFVAEQLEGSVIYWVEVRNVVIKDGKKMYSDPVSTGQISVRFEAAKQPPVITKQPVTVKETQLGETVTISLTATGDNLKYEWRCGVGMSSTEICSDTPSLYSGYDTPTLTFQVTEKCFAEGFGFWCFIQNDSGFAESNSVKVLPKYELWNLVGIDILAMPEKIVYTKGETFQPGGLILKLLLIDGYLQGNVYRDMTFSPTILNTVGTQKITVTYQEKTTTFNVTVKEPPHTHSFTGAWKSDATNHWQLCSCGEKGNVAPHTFSAWKVTQVATETAAGLRERVCTVCGYKQTEVIAKLPHTHVYGTEWKYNDSQHWHECDCGEGNGNAPHTFGEWTVTKEATEAEEGLQNHTCSVCGYAESSVIPVLEHEHSYSEEWKSDATNHWQLCSCGEKGNVAAHTYGEWETVKEATETAEGSKKRVCSVCGYEGYEAIPVNGAETSGTEASGSETSGTETSDVSTPAPIAPEKPDDSFPWWIIVVAVVAVGGIAAVAIIIFKKKKQG